MTRPKRMTCSVCGSGCVNRQWFNRDTGYGLCLKCVGWLKERGTSPEEMQSGYGKEGVNYAIPGYAED